MKRSPILEELEIGLCVCGIILLTHLEAHGVDIETIRKRVRAGDFLVKGHAIQHAIKEGFDRRHMVEAIINGTIIEKYPDDQRALICGQANLDEATTVYLHVVCEYTDPVYIEFITAYLPDETWEKPPFRRRWPKRN